MSDGPEDVAASAALEDAADRGTETPADVEHYAEQDAADEHYGPDGARSDDPPDAVIVQAETDSAFADAEFGEQIAALARAVALLDGLPDADNVDETADRLASVLAAIADLTALRDRLNGWLAELVGHTTRKEIEIDGTVWRRNASKARREWQHDELAGAVARAILAPDGDGVIRTGAEVFDEVGKAYKLGGDKARLTWLREHDIDPDDYCVADVVTVTFRPVP